MITFEIDIPDHIYKRGMRYARDNGITFSELCSLGAIELMRLPDNELLELTDEFRENEVSDRG
jgi:hypothetical protein